MPKKKKGAKKPAAAAPAPAPAPAPEPAVEDAVPAAAAKGDAAKTAKSLDSVTDGFATGQKMGTDVSTMNAAVASLGSQDPAKAAAEAAQRCVHAASPHKTRPADLLLTQRCAAAVVAPGSAPPSWRRLSLCRRILRFTLRTAAVVKTTQSAHCGRRVAT